MLQSALVLSNLADIGNYYVSTLWILTCKINQELSKMKKIRFAGDLKKTVSCLWIFRLS